ncbi:hypothetical protein [Streptodolium elevatio]|uniref:GNAT family N-acetyltransferase n=1 Tax=Streptodolium elevatio TaxID=3157996 RepID=A0ABV3DU92_9ACTN
MELTQVLARMRELMALPGNDFGWSSWNDAAEALAEFDALAAEVGAGGRPAGMRLLFLPTGPLQELSISSGWGNDYLYLAARFDEAFQAE